MLLYDRSSAEQTVLMNWLQKVTNNKIRSLEESKTSILRIDTGRPLRGIMLAHDFYLGRDRRFYKIVGGRAHPLTTAQGVLAYYSIGQIKAMFSAATERKAAARMERATAH